MRPDGTEARNIFEVDAAQAICCVYFFGDGRRLAYLLADDSGDRLFARDLKGGNVTPLLQPATGDVGDFVWLPDGRLIYADVCNLLQFDTPCNLWIERFDTRSGRVLEKSRRLTTVMGASLSFPSVTADGKVATFQQSTEYKTAYVAALEAGARAIRNVRHFTLEEGDDAIADWTPDGQAAIVVKNRADYSAVYEQAVRNDVTRPIVARFPGAVLGGAFVSPDGKWLSLGLWSVPSSTSPPWFRAPPPLEVWRVPINGVSPQRLFSLRVGSSLSCARAPSSLCVTGEPTADRREIVVSAFDPSAGRRGRELLRFDRYANWIEDTAPLAFALSPDGKWLSTSPAPSGPLRILSLRAAATHEITLNGITVKGDARWTPDGTGLIVTGYRNGSAELLHVDLRGKIDVLWQCESGQSCFGVPSPDGRHLGISQTRVNSNIWMLENF
jgi:Tol biopolymer transport system component